MAELYSNRGTAHNEMCNRRVVAHTTKAVEPGAQTRPGDSGGYKGGRRETCSGETGSAGKASGPKRSDYRGKERVAPRNG